MRRRFNPYIAGAPVLDDDMFYGREKLTARMLSTLHRNSLMITGERRIGKTTFLHHLKHVLAEDEAGEWRFFPVFVDLQGVPEQSFFHALMAEIVDALDLSPATRQALRFTPEPEGYDARDFGHDLQQVIAELRTRTDRKVKLALLIDEVDVLNEYSESVNQRLRGIFMKSFSENLVAVMSGVGISRRWKSEASPWYNFFDEIELLPFSREEAEALVREPVAGRLPLEARGGRAGARAVAAAALPRPEALRARGEPHARGRAEHDPPGGRRRGARRRSRARTRPRTPLAAEAAARPSVAD